MLVVVGVMIVVGWRRPMIMVVRMAIVTLLAEPCA